MIFTTLRRLFVVCLAMVASLLGCLAERARGERPNILFILADKY